MTRARLSVRRTATLAFACLTMVLAFRAGVAQAQSKDRPTIAVLGLEVQVAEGQAVSDEATRIAKELTSALRARADRMPTPFSVADNSSKELIDEKMINSCNDEAPECMAKIAGNLKAAYLLWGKLEKTTKDKEQGYKLNLTLLKVATKQTTTAPGWLPNSAKTPSGIKTAAEDMFAKLAKGELDGTLVIKSNIERGTILVNGVAKGTIENGRGEISLAEDSYKISIEADGYRSVDLDASIKAGGTVNRTVDLEKADTLTDRGGTVSGRKSYTGWKVTAGAGLAVSAAAGAWWAYLYFGPIRSYSTGDQAAFAPNTDFTMPTGLGVGQCDTTNPISHPTKDTSGEGTKRFKDACSAQKLTKVAIPITIGAGVIGGAALIYVLTRDSGNEQRPVGAGRSTKRRQNIAVTPIVSPTGAGATFRIDW